MLRIHTGAGRLFEEPGSFSTRDLSSKSQTQWLMAALVDRQRFGQVIVADERLPENVGLIPLISWMVITRPPTLVALLMPGRSHQRERNGALLRVLAAGGRKVLDTAHIVKEAISPLRLLRCSDRHDLQDIGIPPYP